jgi:hypothetical protein
MVILQDYLNHEIVSAEELMLRIELIEMVLV